VVFLSTESMARATDLVREIDQRVPGIQTVAVSRVCDPQLLLECMKVGIREFASLPIDIRSLAEALNRIRGVVESKPPAIETTEQMFCFLPSKAGVGTSTIALNTAMALSCGPEANVLLSDFDMNSGMIRFMLKLDNTFSVTDACEHALNIDENLWPQLVTRVDKLDVLHAGKLNPDLRIEATQIRHLIEFMRRNYRVLCFDLSGNLERYSLEIMHESKRIMLVCTPEIPSLHLAREKYTYLKQLDLGDRVCVLLNRCQKRPMITPQQIEQLLGLPVHMTLPNDYHGVQRALTLGRWVDPTSDLGKQFQLLAQSMVESPRPQSLPDQKKRFIEYFSVVPGRYGSLTNKTAS
jgi:pilus assembly protein CpaE